MGNTHFVALKHYDFLRKRALPIFNGNQHIATAIVAALGLEVSKEIPVFHNPLSLHPKINIYTAEDK